MNFISKEEKVLYYILSITVLIDLINGFIISNLNIDISIGMISRSLIIILNILYISKYSKKSTIILYFIILPFVITSIISFYTIHQDVSALIYDIKDIFIVIYYISMLNLFIILNKYKKIQETTVYKIIINNSIFLVIGIVVTYILGIGFNSYEGNTGFKGTLYSLNALSVVTLVMFTILYDSLIREKHNFKNIILLISISIIMLMIGAKSLYALMIFIILLSTITADNYKFIIKSIFFIFIGSVGLVLLVKYFFYDAFSEIINRQFYFLKLRQENFFTFLLSSRDIFLESAIVGFKENFSLRRIFIGIGAYAERFEIAKYLQISAFKLKSIEMDIFDIFFTYGLWGIVNSYGIVISIFISNIKNMLYEKKRYFISMIVIVIYSILGGHVFTEPLSITFLNICILGIMISDKSEICKDN